MQFAFPFFFPIRKTKIFQQIANWHSFGRKLSQELMRARRGESETVPPGVWYPAELGEEARANIMRVVREKATVWEM